MMGRLSHDQEQFFYSFRLDETVPDDHPVREIAAVLDLSWVHSELAAYYPRLGRPSIDPVLTLAGDRVTVEVSPYDLEKGRLIFRHKDERAGSLSRPPQRHQFRRR